MHPEAITGITMLLRVMDPGYQVENMFLPHNETKKSFREPPQIVCLVVKISSNLIQVGSWTAETP